MRYSRLRKRVFPLSAALILALSTIGLAGGGTASAAPIPLAALCHGPYAQINYTPGLTLVPQPQTFTGFSHSTGCLGTGFNGGLVMESITGGGPLLSCLASSGTTGTIVFRWSDNQTSIASVINLPVNNASKAIVLKFVVNSGKFAGNQGTLTVESLGNTVLCAFPGGLRRIEGPVQFEFGV